MSAMVLLVIAIAAGILVGFLARRLPLSWIIVGGGGFLAAVAVFIALASSTPPVSSAAAVSAPAATEVQSTEASQPTLSKVQVPPAHQPPVQADVALRQRCIEQAKAQHYRSGQCAYTFIDTCIRTQSRQTMEAVLRTDAMLGMGEARSCPNMPSTFAAEFDRF